MRFTTLMLMLVLAAASAASARNARVQCEDDSSRCENAAGVRNDSSIDGARHRPAGPQPRLETGERATQAPTRAPPANRRLPSERERPAAGPKTSDDAGGDPPVAAAPPPVIGTTEAAGLGPWARVLAIVMAAAGVVSLIVARIADA